MLLLHNNHDINDDIYIITADGATIVMINMMFRSIQTIDDVKMVRGKND